MPLSTILQNRVYLLTVIGFLTTISALAPFLLQEFIIEMVAHSILHITAITFGVFLIILSLIAYNSTRNTNMIFTALAFATFTALSIFLLEEDLAAERMEHNEAVWVDILLTIMIGFFGIGVFSNQKFPTRRKYD
ncbi:uncharacterized protein METZ01_LOCUS480728 [marine metagenome]|uniref:Uncharacterized protein n=1 Tax=marine metagenome TaxID=408172 RepID=A0A383C6Q8_9ZZZZ